MVTIGLIALLLATLEYWRDIPLLSAQYPDVARSPLPSAVALLISALGILALRHADVEPPWMRCATRMQALSPNGCNPRKLRALQSGVQSARVAFCETLNAAPQRARTGESR